LTDVKISFVGSFIWLEDEVKGATYQQKEAIKSIVIDGLNSAKFAGKKKVWYLSPIDYKQKSKSKKDLNEIKNTFGCSSYKMQGQKQIS
jgi:hypothetical protein